MTPSPQPPDPLASVEDTLASLGTVPLDEQAPVFEDVHRRLTQALDSTAQQSNPAPEAR